MVVDTFIHLIFKNPKFEWWCDVKHETWAKPAKLELKRYLKFYRYIYMYGGKMFSFEMCVKIFKRNTFSKSHPL